MFHPGDFAEVVNPKLSTYGMLLEVVCSHPDNFKRLAVNNSPLFLVERGNGSRFWIRQDSIAKSS